MTDPDPRSIPVSASASQFETGGEARGRRRPPVLSTGGLRDSPGRGSGSEDLVEQRLGLVLVGVLGERQLGDEDLPGLGEHPLLTGREPAVALATPQVADYLGHLHDVTRVQLLEVRLVAT